MLAQLDDVINSVAAPVRPTYPRLAEIDDDMAF